MAAVAPAQGWRIPRVSWAASRETRFGSFLAETVDRAGFVLVTDTPATREALLGIARVMGSLELGIDEELSGPPVMDLRYDESKAVRFDRPAYFSSNDFPLHTDLSYVANPPRYLLTLCVERDAAGGGVSLLSDCRAAWSGLYPADRVRLGARVFTFRNAPNTGDGECAARGLHEAHGSHELWRYRADTLEYPPELADSVDRFRRRLDEERLEISMERGDLLVIDNHRVVHGRTAFAAPSSRHLLRAYAQDPSLVLG